LSAYQGELVRMSDLVRKNMRSGKTVDQLKAEKVLAPWAAWGDSFITAERFLDTLTAAVKPETASAKPSVLDFLIPALQKGDGAVAVALYKKLKKEKAEAFLFDEAEINQLGYVLLQRHRMADAIAILRLNVEEHPESSNAYDSLAEGYMNDGQKDLAIQNYKKSLELNPANTNAVEMLKRLEKQ